MNERLLQHTHSLLFSPSEKAEVERVPPGEDGEGGDFPLLIINHYLHIIHPHYHPLSPGKKKKKKSTFKVLKAEFGNRLIIQPVYFHNVFC